MYNKYYTATKQPYAWKMLISRENRFVTKWFIVKKEKSLLLLLLWMIISATSPIYITSGSNLILVVIRDVTKIPVVGLFNEFILYDDNYN